MPRNRKEKRKLTAATKRANKSKRQGGAAGAAFRVEVVDAGPPGVAGEFWVVGQTATRRRTIAEVTRDLEVRDFRVVAHLTKPHAPASKDVSVPASVNDGSSYILAPENSVGSLRLAVFGVQNVSDEECWVHCNHRREVASFELRCRARSKAEATAKFEALISPAINLVAFGCNVPLCLQCIVVHDEKHLTMTVDYVIPYHDVRLEDAPSQCPRDIFPFLALYREALGSDSALYQTLCYTKIMEGSFRWLRPQIYDRQRSFGLSKPEKDKDLVPSSPELLKTHPEWVGKPIQPLYEKHFEPILRHAVAHFALDEEPPITVSDFDTQALYNNSVHILQMCSRAVLVKDIELVERLQKECAVKGIEWQSLVDGPS